MTGAWLAELMHFLGGSPIFIFNFILFFIFSQFFAQWFSIYIICFKNDTAVLTWQEIMQLPSLQHNHGCLLLFLLWH
jgi:hypothetical protein